MSTVLGRLHLHSRGALCAELLARIRVSIDGDQLLGVVAFDTWQGWVDVHRRDDRGLMVMCAGAAQIERRHGTVRATVLRPTAVDVAELRHRGLAFA